VLLVKNAQPYRNPVVLAALDPSHAFAKPAKLDDEVLRHASSVQKALRGTLHAVHAYAPMPSGTTRAERKDPETVEILEARARQAAHARLQPLLKKIRITRARQHLIGKRPIAAISEVARDTGTALVVMGAISRSGMKRVFIGNTAELILDAIGCDVLVVKTPQVLHGTRPY
jgi:nucleotide-binding universal stress UspA family protein